MEIRVTRSYRDKTADMKLRNIGDVYEADPERAKELIDAKFAVENTITNAGESEKVAAQPVEEPEAESENAESAEAVEVPEAPKKTKKTTKAQ